MRTLFVSVYLFIFSYISVAQIQVVSVFTPTKAQSNKQARVASQSSDTLSLPFFDDFTNTETNSLNTEKWDSNSGVYVNNDFCQNPPNFQVATFDGADKQGNPYVFLPNSDDINLSINDFTDELISCPINLLGQKADSNVVFSFFWQKGGLTEHHEPTEVDSLYLYFLDLDSNWVKVWPTEQDHLTAVQQAQNGEFYSEFINITDTIFFHEGFRFRFNTFGRATGPWDIWSVDYILLDNNRDSELIVDFGYSNTPSPLLNGYSQVPFNHFKNNPNDFLNTSVTTTVRSLSTEPNIVKDSTIIIKETVSNQTLDSTNLEDTKIINALESYELSWDFSPNTLAFEDEQTYALFETTFNLSSSGNDTILSNNQIQTTTLLANEYAYDDGTAEGGIGIREYGLIAYKYEIKETDSLSAISIYFPKIEVNMANTTINIRVWKSLEGVDGASETELVYNLTTQLLYSDTVLNQFTTYPIASIDDPLILEAGTYYIGYEQPNSLYRLYIGLDENTNSIENLYYLSGGEWNQDFLEEGVKGSLMMRPKFGYTPDPTLNTVKAESKPKSYIVYPNPTQGDIYIQGDFESIMVTDLQGRIILETTESTFSLVEQAQGMYLIHIFDQEQRVVKKVVVE
ncbi:MAG: T9SS type A sorting domain-containing protein [Cytophagales bacterium]|nr:T9SS type A sorting domain-containing protein [Cytophagales bacterium]